MEGFMISYRDLTTALNSLNIDPTQPIIAHVSMSSFGEEINGGASTVIGALLNSFDTIIMPAFTYQCILIPRTGPPHNGIIYGSNTERNQEASFFYSDLPVHPSIGLTAESLRKHPDSTRSTHPILSFTGINAQSILETQTNNNPLAPIGALTSERGWALLIGVDQRANTSIHYAERLGRRKQFLRWALTPGGVVECPNFPGCSDGFNQLNVHLQAVKRIRQVGEALIYAIPLQMLTAITGDWIRKDPTALLCDKDDCQRCQIVKNSA